MKLRNKKTGQVGNFIINKDHFECVDLDYVPEYRNIAELNAEWEDYEEPKTEYYITAWGDIREYSTKEERFAFKQKLEIGNYFETEEEAQKAVEKLKAWKRLEDKGVKFKLDFVRNTIHFTYRIDGTLHSVVDEERIIFEDMKTIFGGENEATE